MLCFRKRLLCFPHVDAVGLDIVTIFAALELRHYVASVARVVGIPTSVAVYLRVAAQVGEPLRRCPTDEPGTMVVCVYVADDLAPYMGTMSVPPPVQL